MNDEFTPLNNGEIISFNFGNQLNLPSNGFSELQLKTQQFTEVITRRLNVTDNNNQSLFDKGVNCEVIKFGASGWQKGKLRAKIVLEFCPDEPPVEKKPSINQSEPPLDDISRPMGESL
ncbi:hypothetical protein CAL7716_101780 (plasmid) [Calothrix sp. PCC 7716]|nr:hypothetical protein CAL7716_101780 [Calothrix sp. PCC 7716]